MPPRPSSRPRVYCPDNPFVSCPRRSAKRCLCTNVGDGAASPCFRIRPRDGPGARACGALVRLACPDGRESVPFEGHSAVPGRPSTVAIHVGMSRILSPSDTALRPSCFCGCVRQRLEKCEDLTSRVARYTFASVTVARWPDFCTPNPRPLQNPEFRASLSKESKLGSRRYAPGRRRHDLGGARSKQRLDSDRGEIDRAGAPRSSSEERPRDRALVGRAPACGALPASAPSARSDQNERSDVYAGGMRVLLG
jgi:hypothetical protein